MRPRFYAYLALVVGALIAAAMSGCETTPRQAFSQTQDVFITFLQVLDTARETGEFTEEEWQEDIVPLILKGNLLLQQLDTLTSIGQDGGDVLVQIQEVLLALRPFLDRANN